MVLTLSQIVYERESNKYIVKWLDEKIIAQLGSYCILKCKYLCQHLSYFICNHHLHSKATRICSLYLMEIFELPVLDYNMSFLASWFFTFFSSEYIVVSLQVKILMLEVFLLFFFISLNEYFCCNSAIREFYNIFSGLLQYTYQVIKQNIGSFCL